ncbi:NHLP bacteriocin system secretion protein [Dendronalium sp. ChiSLP03b]|uniref:NHLP bacteriocin system secretion protein n=1 Tax=Dendronalium sp. ChiSLP03b TaxID=3075381 RepID=UPI002AD2B987|nr:NHLP bacteriocin system secretion protein [Dendronalium sp. ChiSLP03b]MDZ8207797.1 NHLP bacteriocin system secretion protein [Dendronalium sp. ChiSLP03b]
MGPILKDKGLDSIERDRTNQKQRLKALRELLPTFKQRLNNRQQLLQQGAIAAQQRVSQRVSVAFFPVGDGKQIQPGMKVQITPSTVQRERFGGIIGAVTDVSAFTVTKESALSVVGNSEFVQAFMSQGPQIQVTAQLQPDASTFSGYKWSSSQGPQLQVTPGTTTTVQVTVEERAPTTFVLPLLKSWSGIN